MGRSSRNTEASQVLTEVDLASERLIVETLSPLTKQYQLGILTEETEDDSSRHTSDYFWCIDPIDGTLPFIEGTPGYSIVIALVSREGVPQLGVIWDVVADVPYHVLRGNVAFRGEEAIEAASTGSSSSSSSLRWFMDRSMVGQSNYNDWHAALIEAAGATGLDGVEVIDHAGAALNASWSTLNDHAVYFKCPKKEDGGGSVWDFAASACLYESLGLPVSDMFGHPLDLNPEGSTFMNRGGVVYASSLEWARTVQSIYKELG
ncbi:MAG: inositol monophosphatase family protein [Verrucomicrobiota bacterium]